MQDRFKFRVWDKDMKRFQEPFSLRDGIPLYADGQEWQRDYIVSQCTGLRDKNGKLMFEGDIVHKSGSKFNGEKILSEIEWCETSAHFVYSDYIGIGGSHEFRTGTAGKMEVLGNIYENPELIKEKI